MSTVVQFVSRFQNLILMNEISCVSTRLAIQRLELTKNDLRQRIAKEVTLNINYGPFLCIVSNDEIFANSI